MGYLHINNLYKDQTILMCRECYALEKIHGTSAHIRWDGQKIGLFSGGAPHDRFVALFDRELLAGQLRELFGDRRITIYGEAYGGKIQGMRATYGEALRFVAFDVSVGRGWLNVPEAEKIVLGVGLEFVAYKRVATDVDALNKERDRPSVQAVRNGIEEPRPREGVVLRPIEELRKQNGERLIAKHKAAEFCETKTPRAVNAAAAQILQDARAVADEWVTEMRLTHVLDKFPGASVEQTGGVIKAMIADVCREGEGEFEDSRAVRAAIGKRTAQLFHRRLRSALAEVGA